MSLTPAVYILLYALAGGLWFRFRGSGWLNRSLRGVPWVNPARFILISGWAVIMCLPLWWLAPWWAAAGAIAITTAATAQGHGDWMGEPDRAYGPVQSEIFDPLVHWLMGRSHSTPLHNAIGMSISGMSYTLVPAFVAAWFASPLWLLWLPIGTLKALAYWLGWNVFGFKVPIPQFDRPTAMGEFLTGFLTCGGAGLLWWVY